MNYSQVSSRHKMTGRDSRALRVKKTSTKIGEGICRESDVVIGSLVPSINL